MDVASERAYSTPLSNSTLLPMLLLTLASQKHSPDTSYLFNREYDYIIVGAGAGGSVVASRLSEYPCVSVLLLEAGHEPPLLTDLPSLGRYFWNSDVDWKYSTVPQKHTAAGLKNRQIPWACGKMIGGSSSLNSMLYVRGNKRNYDQWEDMGASGWNYEDVYPYFLKLEDNRTPEIASDGYHTFGGPISVEQPRYHPDLKEAVREGARSLGYEILDSNAARQTGFYDQQASIRNNQRCSTAKAYLVPAENRTNLDIIANAFVTKILIEGGQANGVQFDIMGQTFRVAARREVILSAGAINTPQILKLSGVGPRAELEKLGIPVKANLAVGKNLVNHGGAHYSFVLNHYEPDFDQKIKNPNNIMQFIHNRTGPLASSDGYLFVSFLKGLTVRPAEDFPNYELYITERPISLIKNSGLKPEVYQQIYGPYENRAIFTCTISQVQPYSRGAVTLQSSNPYDNPLIDPNYLDDDRDVQDIVEGLKSCKRLLNTDAMRKAGVEPFKTLVPGCEHYDGDDDKYFRCEIKTLISTFHHPAGTAKMGNPADPFTVVDPELRVKFIKKLRIVDASVMPTVTSGNTHIPTVMIAEKASDLIKKTINCFPKKSSIRENAFQPPFLVNKPKGANEFGSWSDEQYFTES